VRALALAALWFAAIAGASPEADRARELIASGDLVAARAHIDTELDAGSTSNRLLYELARLEAIEGDEARAGATLVAAVAAGFTDFYALSRDARLAATREGRTILAGRAAILEDRGRADFEAVQRAFPKKYRFVRVDALRLQFASAFDESLTAEVIDEAVALREWVHSNLWDAPDDPALDPWVTVLLPTPEDFVRLVGASGVGGYYDPEKRRLVSADLGPSYRHELMHVFHFRRLERLGQRRPHWFTEGLAALHEDLDPARDGFVPVGSWRTDIAKRRLAAGRLRSWDDLFAQDHDRFVGHRPRAQYAQSRAIAMYLHDRGLLRDVCAAFERTVGDDPLGLAAVAAAAGGDTKQAELAFRGWLATLGTGEPDVVAETARLGLILKAGRGDGPEIERTESRSPASAARLRRRDVIRAVDGRPVRTVAEFLRAVATPGRHEVLVRRGRATPTLILETPPD